MIGVIVKTNMSADELTESWIPDVMDIGVINSAFYELVGYKPISLEFTHEKDSCLIHFTLDSDVEPRAITFSCTANLIESNLINTLAG